MPAVLQVPVVSADKISVTFEWHIGDDFLASVNQTFGVPSVARAANGDTIAVKGTGALTFHAKAFTGEGTFDNGDRIVAGGGTFVHKDSSGHEIAHGTWEAKGLRSFVSFGDASAQELPSILFGGVAVIRVRLFVGTTRVHDGALTVLCALGNVPAGVEEGITLNVKDAIDFNEQLSGFTVYVKTS